MDESGLDGGELDEDKLNDDRLSGKQQKRDSNNERGANMGKQMNESQEQKEVMAKIELEYAEYLSRLERKSIQEIIAESERTSFYADMVFYAREKQLSKGQLECLSQNNTLEKAYKCYLKNDYKYLDTMRNFGRLLYQFVKEWERQEQEQM